MPELYDLDPAIYRIQHRTKKSVDGNLVSGFFQHLSSGRSKRALTWIELAFWQDPGLVPSQSHDCEARSGAFPVRQFRPQPESARPPPNQSYQRYAGRTRVEQVESSREQGASPGFLFAARNERGAGSSEFSARDCLPRREGSSPRIGASLAETIGALDPSEQDDAGVRSERRSLDRARCGLI
jgi:hypothetical protein